MTNAIAVGTVASQVLEGYRPKPALVVNVGTLPVFLGDTTSVGDGISIPLYPNFSIQWDADVPMWAVCSGDGRLVISLMRGQINAVYDPT